MIYWSVFMHICTRQVNPKTHLILMLNKGHVIDISLVC